MARRSINEKQLQQLAVPSADWNAHRAQLKRALVAASRPENRPKWSKYSMRKNKFTIPSLATVVAVVVIVAMVAVQVQSPVSAAELTQKSLRSVAALSDDERRVLDMRVSNPEEELRAAKQAKDLTALTYDEYKALPQPGGTNETATDGVNMQKLTFLKYTDAEGATHIIGIDAKSLPVMVLVYKIGSYGAGQSSMTVQGMNGEDGAAADAAMGAPAQGSGMTTCSKSADGQPVCTTSDGSNPICETEANGAISCKSAQ
jgi:hypothetical protein